MKTTKIKSKIWMEDSEHYIFGDGRAKLLNIIDETGSIKAASEKLGISYRRAWGYIQKLEERLDIQLVEHQIGGKDGGGSTLTKKAYKFLKKYERIRKDINKYVDKKFKKLEIK